MRVLYVSGTYYPSQAGAEVSAQTFLRHLVRRGDECMVLTGYFGTIHSDTPSVSEHRGIPVIRQLHQKRESSLHRLLDDFKPNVLLTQQMWSDVALRVAKARDIPSVLRVCRIPYELDISLESVYAPSAILSVSEAARTDVLTRWHRDSLLIPPPVDEFEICIPGLVPWKNPYIALFNPIKEKGAELFATLARSMPARQFAVIPGWACLRDRNGEFDRNAIEILCESLGIPSGGHPPNEVDLHGIPNVTYLEPQDDVRVIYGRTHILCIPSIVQESFGRVAVEAAFNGIPIVASDLAGLRESAAGGLLIREFNDVLLWIKAIRDLEDQTTYQKISDRERLAAQRTWSAVSAGDQLRNLLSFVVA